MDNFAAISSPPSCYYGVPSRQVNRQSYKSRQLAALAGKLWAVAEATPLYRADSWQWEFPRKVTPAAISVGVSCNLDGFMKVRRFESCEQSAPLVWSRSAHRWLRKHNFLPLIHQLVMWLGVFCRDRYVSSAHSPNHFTNYYVSLQSEQSSWYFIFPNINCDGAFLLDERSLIYRGFIFIMRCQPLWWNLFFTLG